MKLKGIILSVEAVRRLHLSTISVSKIHPVHKPMIFLSFICFDTGLYLR